MSETTRTDQTTMDAEGRLFVLTGPGADDVARALTAALPRAASVDGAVIEAMFTGEGGVSPSDARTALETRYLRYTAGIALADSFRLAGFDAVVAEDVPDDHLEAGRVRGARAGTDRGPDRDRHVHTPRGDATGHRHQDSS